MRCSPSAVAVPPKGTEDPRLQAICIADTSPLAKTALCDMYEPAMPPANATGTTTATTGPVSIMALTAVLTAMVGWSAAALVANFALLLL